MEKLYLEDLVVGQRFVSREYLLTLDQIKTFAAEYDPQSFHMDESRAAQHPVFQGLAASGWQTAAITMRLWSECFPIAGGLLGLGANLVWKMPTRPNDRLRVEVEILNIQPSKSKPQQAIVTYVTHTKNQHDQTLQETETKILVWSKTIREQVEKF